MSLRPLAILGIVAVLIIAYVAWTRNLQRPAGVVESPSPAGGASGEMPPSVDTAGTQGSGTAEPHAPLVQSGADPGLVWHVPPGWTSRGASTMRLATYVIHGPNDTEAQCAVYYFGAGQGGSVEANLERWRGEFKDATQNAPRNFNAPGGRVTLVSLEGTYMAHVGMMGDGSSTELTRWALLGAIAEGPHGSVFFKLTGPKATVEAAAKDFEHMLRSIHKA